MGKSLDICGQSVDAASLWHESYCWFSVARILLASQPAASVLLTRDFAKSVFVLCVVFQDPLHPSDSLHPGVLRDSSDPGDSRNDRLQPTVAFMTIKYT